MLITNGTTNRDIAAERFPEYASKGYYEVAAVKPATASAPVAEVPQKVEIIPQKTEPPKRGRKPKAVVADVQ